MAVGGSSENDDNVQNRQAGAHDPSRNGFTLQQLELSLLGAVDLFFTAEVHLIFSTNPDGETVTQLIRDRLSGLRPSHKAKFEARYAAFHQRLGASLVGESLAAKYDVAKLALLANHGKLDAFLESQGELDLLVGWLGRMRAYRGTRVVVDHNQWIYFTQRFGLNIAGMMEPKPGLPPTTRHLRTLIKDMQTQDVKLILLGAYFDPRHARFLAKHTDAKVVNMAHQVGARPEANDYFRLMDYNIEQIQTGLTPSN